MEKINLIQKLNLFKTALIKPSIEMDLLEKIDIRVGTIIQVDDIEKSNKLVKLAVDFGDFTRTILVGMKGERDNPKEIEGQQALFVVNLAPKKMAGEISEGMLFDIGYADGIIPVLAQPEKPVPNGTRVG
ncbi:MAG TPA: tRNA-binding protein [Clostridia bacterium]|nr:tRNA-binding protein [Clostridia bacterium]